MNLFSKSNLSLMNKIILAFVSYVVCILLVFSLIVVLVDRGHVKSISDSYSQSILKDKQALTDGWVNEQVRDLQVMALTDEVMSGDPKAALDFLDEAVKQYDTTYARLYFIDLEGTMHDTLGIKGEAEQSYDFTEGPVIKDARYDDTFHQPSFEVMVPVVNDGRPVGVLGSTVLIKELGENLTMYEGHQQGYGWVVNGEGLIMSHYDETLIGGSFEDEEVAADLTLLIEEAALAEMGTGEFVNGQGEKEYVVYSQLASNPDWYVLVSLYHSDVYKTIPTLIRSLALIFVVIVMLSAIVSWFLAKDITQPIQSLIEVTTKFTTGVKGIRANIDSKDEIGTLAQSFNNMADTIVAHTDNLEELIKERTSTLADLNYQIVSRNKELGTMNEELEKTNNKLHELASTDMLTGLYNRHQFQRDLQKTMELVNAGREDSFALLFIDLDNFKYYNDTFSHEIGDFLLQSVSDILVGNVRGNDLVGRYGGDEFVILLREGNYDIAKTIAQRIHKAILDRDGFKKELQRKLNADVKIMGKNKLSSSIGIVRYMKNMNMTNSEDLLAKADETMYKAKNAGKSRVVVG